jgi:branched-subunit amino acid aminotransferase/4-amino-4-deoxychorismate lyase
MAMHEIRVLVAERSTMNIYIKTRNQNLITPPAVLLPSNADLSLFGLESSGFQAVLSPSSYTFKR